MRRSVTAGIAGYVTTLVPERGPARRWALVNLIGSVGDGLFLSGSAVFATKIIGLAGDEVGLGISLGGLAGLVGSAMLGRLADRVGSRRLLVVLYLTQAVLYVGYSLTGSFALFVAVMCLISIGKNGALAAAAALVAEIADGEGRVRLRAQARSLYNVGFSAGAAVAAVALAIDLTPGYYLLPLGNAVAMLVACLVVRGLPETRVSAVRRRFGPEAVRNLPFMLTTGLTGVLAMHLSLVTVVVPLWIVERTTVPQAMIGAMLVLNTAIVVVFQVAASKGADSLAGGTRKARIAAVALAAGCVALAPTGALPTALAVVAVVVAFALLSVGEIVQSASGWAMSYTLAPREAQAEYLGTFSMSQAGQSVLAPALGTFVVLRHGATGWAALAVIILLAAWAVGPTARWADAAIRRRHPDESPGEVHTA